MRDLLVGYAGTTGELGPLAILNIGIPPSDAAGYASHSAAAAAGSRQYERLPVHGLLVPARRARNRRAAASLPEGRPAGAGAAEGGRPVERPDQACHQRSGLRPNAGNVAGQSAAAARLEPAASRAAGRLPRHGREAVGREDDLPLGRQIRFAAVRRRPPAVDLDRPATGSVAAADF